MSVTPIKTLRRQVRIAAARSFDTGVRNVEMVTEKRFGGMIHVSAVCTLGPSAVLAAGWARSERGALLEAVRSVMDDVRGYIEHDREELRKSRHELTRLRALVKKGAAR